MNAHPMNMRISNLIAGIESLYPRCNHKAEGTTARRTRSLLAFGLIVKGELGALKWLQ